MNNDTKKTILIVDDNAANRDLLAAMLKVEDMVPVMAADGTRALACVAKTPPDLILLDIMMPGMNGFDVVRQLKSDDTTAHIPVIMVTALDDRESITRALDAGADEVLAKPVNTTEFLLCVKDMLQLHNKKAEGRLDELQVARLSACNAQAGRVRVNDPNQLNSLKDRSQGDFPQ